MAKTNSTPKGTVANRTGANMKKQKRNINAGAETTNAETKEVSLKRRNKKQNLNAGADKPVFTPAANKVELKLEDIANNKFEELAVAVAYAKTEQEKESAVKSFADFFNGEIPADKKAAVKEMLATRLKEDDFIYGSEFIDLTGLRQYQDKLFENSQVEKEFEPHSSTFENKQPETNRTSEKEKAIPLTEQELYQTLIDGINNEEIKNIKGYSKDDLQKILDYQEELLNGKDNATAFESLHENSIADLKKFAGGDMTIDNDSYETMLQFIKVFGTNYKGELTPEGKAAYDKLMDLMAKSRKEKILKNKKEYQKKAAIVDSVKDNANAALAGILGGLAANAVQREKGQAEASPDFTIGMETPEEEKENSNAITQPETNRKKEEKRKMPVAGIIPIPPSNGNENNSNIPSAIIAGEKTKEPEKKKGWWGRLKDKVKRNWKKIAALAAAAATAAALLFMPKNCNGNGDAVPPKPDDGKNNTPDKEIVVKQDTITLDPNDLVDGFYLERSAGFKAEQEKINFHDAEKANKADLLTIKKLLAHGKLDKEQFIRHDSSKDEKPVSVAEIAYKMRIVTQNFPNSKVGAAINRMFSGRISKQDADRIYAAFNHVDDFGNLINNKGKIIEGTPGKKTIDSERMGPGSAEYGTQGTDNNFLQVLKNHRNARNK